MRGKDPPATPAGKKTKTPRRTGAAGSEKIWIALGYFAAKTLAACALARDAAFLCTTPDFTALSIAETYSAAALLLAVASFAAIDVSSRLRNVFKRVLTPRLRSVRRTVLRAALIADLVLAMVCERLELAKDSNARRRVKGVFALVVAGARSGSIARRCNRRTARGTLSGSPASRCPRIPIAAGVLAGRSRGDSQCGAAVATPAVVDASFGGWKKSASATAAAEAAISGTMNRPLKSTTPFAV